MRETAAAAFEAYLKPCADSGDDTLSRKPLGFPVTNCWI